MYKPELVLIRGLPGSGKSTMAKTLCYNPDWAHFEADMFWENNGGYTFSRLDEAHAWCRESTYKALSCFTNVVVTNTFTTIRELRPYFEFAKELGIVPNVLVAQNNFDSIHNVPIETVEKMRRRFVWDLSELFNEYKIV